jgi:monoamine oxidase
VARTPLFTLIQRSYRAARSPEAPAIARPRSERITRRAFLQGTTAAAGALTLGGCASLPRRRPAEPQVLIVGAGLAGLTAAYRLRQAGVRVRVLEAQDRLGGRCLSLRGKFADGQVAELGGELIDTGHAHIRALCEELEIPLDDLSIEPSEVHRECFHFGGQRYSEAEVVEAFRPVAALIARDLATIGGDGDISYAHPHNAAALDQLSIAEWLTAARVSGWFRSLLETAYTTEYGLETGDQSALNLLLLISPEPDPFRVFGESDERFHVQGGNDRIVRALASYVGNRVDTGVVLEAIDARSDGAIELSLRSGAQSYTLAAPHVVLALPFTMLRRVKMGVELPPAKRLAIDELAYGTNAKLMVGFDSRPWRTAHQSNGSVLTDLPFQCTWETSRGQEGKAGILTNFTGGAQGLRLGDGDPGEQVLRLLGDLERVFAGVSGARRPAAHARSHWPSNPWVLGSYSGYRPGQWTTIHGAEGERVGNLRFAGEHCSANAQGFLEGAVETGEAAAAEILADLGIPVPQRKTADRPTGTGALAWRRRHEVVA